MGLPWVRLDTNIFDHPKLLALREDDAHRAIVLHLQAMCYSHEYNLAGFVPGSCLRMLTSASEDAWKHCSTDAQALIDACLWMPAPGGYTINGFRDAQFVSDEAAARSVKASKAAKARWAKQNNHALEVTDDF